MLVLTRKLHEKIVIGDNVVVTVLRTKGNTVRLGIEAPRSVKVVRGELPAKTDEFKTDAGKSTMVTLDVQIEDDSEVTDESPRKATGPLANRVARLFSQAAV